MKSMLHRWVHIATSLAVALTSATGVAHGGSEQGAEAAKALYESAFTPGARPDSNILRRVIELYPGTKYETGARLELARTAGEQSAKLRAEGHPRAADRLLERAIGLLRPLFSSPDHGHRADAYLWAGFVCELYGDDLEEAYRFYSQAVRFSDDNPRVRSSALLHVADVECRRGDYWAAIQRVDNLLSALDDQLILSVAGGVMWRAVHDSGWSEQAALWCSEVLQGALGPLDPDEEQYYRGWLETYNRRAAKADPEGRVAAYCRLWRGGHLSEMTEYYAPSLRPMPGSTDEFHAAIEAAAGDGVTLASFGSPQLESETEQEASVSVDIDMTDEAPPAPPSGTYRFMLKYDRGVWWIADVQPLNDQDVDEQQNSPE